LTTETLGKVLLDDSKKTSRPSSTLLREAVVWIAKRTNPSSEEGKITNPKIKASLVVLLASTVFATGCGGDLFLIGFSVGIVRPKRETHRLSMREGRRRESPSSPIGDFTGEAF
jgi:hypothetical protein